MAKFDPKFFSPFELSEVENNNLVIVVEGKE